MEDVFICLNPTYYHKKRMKNNAKKLLLLIRGATSWSYTGIKMANCSPLGSLVQCEYTKLFRHIGVQPAIDMCKHVVFATVHTFGTHTLNRFKNSNGIVVFWGKNFRSKHRKVLDFSVNISGCPQP